MAQRYYEKKDFQHDFAQLLKFFINWLIMRMFRIGGLKSQSDAFSGRLSLINNFT